jgi:hypothetical protein
LPFRGFSFDEAPTTRRRRHALVTFFPRIGLVPDLGGEIRGRVRRFPRVTVVTPFFVFRVFVLVEIGPHLLAD